MSSTVSGTASQEDLKQHRSSQLQKIELMGPPEDFRTSQQPPSANKAEDSNRKDPGRRRLTRKELIKRRFQKLEQYQPIAQYRRDLLESLVRTPQQLGTMLRRLEELGSLKTLLDAIESGEEFPEFKQIWDKNEEDLDIEFGQVMIESIYRAVDNYHSGEAYSESIYLTLPVMTLFDPNTLPVLPEFLRGLPWFVTAIKPLDTYVLQSVSVENCCFNRFSGGTLGPILSSYDQQKEDLVHFAITAGHNAAVGSRCLIFNKYAAPMMESKVVLEGKSDIALLELDEETHCIDCVITHIGGIGKCRPYNFGAAGS
ncbi:hypothetical protein ABW20_dc0105847 [Dactylellina cionopaga]|nr:hypothetical protein ABW20_dc0105847 [Dactylellina cionopaga]